MFIYRPMKPGDIPKVKDISNRNITENYTSIFFLSNTLNRPSLNLVCEYEKGVIGFIDCSLNKKDVHLNSICVDYPYRSKGIGYNLLKILVSESKKKYRKILLHVRTTNKIAINCYRKVGFRIIEENIKYYENGALAHEMVYIIG